MALPDSYTVKFSAIPAYFDAILDAQSPERFSLKFLENLRIHVNQRSVDYRGPEGSRVSQSGRRS